MDHENVNPNINLPETPTENSLSKTQSPYKIPLTIIGIFILMVVVGIGTYNLGTQKGRSEAPQLPISTPAATSASQNTSVTLKVIHLQTGYGAEQQTPYVYPETVTIDVPQIYTNKLAAYGVGEHVIVGPKEWTGQGSIGADGNTFVSLYPFGGSAEKGLRVAVLIASTGINSAVEEAAPYNPWIREHWQELQMASPDIPSPPASMQATTVTPHLIRYSLPMTESLENYGVAFSDAQDHLKDQMWSHERMLVSLPVTEYDLGTVILNTFIQTENLDKK